MFVIKEHHHWCTRGLGTSAIAEQDGRFVSLYISELLYKLKMYQEVEIPKRGKYSMSQDLPVLSFLFLVFCFPFNVINLPGLWIFCIFSDGTEYIFSGCMCSLRIMSIKQNN